MSSDPNCSRKNDNASQTETLTGVRSDSGVKKDSDQHQEDGQTPPTGKFQELKNRKANLPPVKTYQQKKPVNKSVNEAVKKPVNTAVTDQNVDSRKRKYTDETEGNQGCSNDWQDLKRYIGQKDHLKGTDKGKYAARTKLEEEIDEALSLGDVERAEKLSNHLSDRQFGSRIADAFDAQKYAEKKKTEEELKLRKKKKKLGWGFEAKERWETKGNM
ncbi:protein FAM204A-like isoform X2 [Tubulanus polymorphus]|uniref:protein FAM204A-like isoform X2 n=1 Tax=Tubulanus polymorphus TaxID=672921 RepID=UPI003DA63433